LFVAFKGPLYSINKQLKTIILQIENGTSFLLAERSATLWPDILAKLGCPAYDGTRDGDVRIK